MRTADQSTAYDKQAHRLESQSFVASHQSYHETGSDADKTNK
jgi:hypothetical protein